MSTRSITHIYEMQNLRPDKIVCSFFRHCDGYPSGHGQDLAEWLKDKALVNGIGDNFVVGRDFNRAGTMAVQLMAHIQALSGCEVIPTGSTTSDQEYTYHVKYDGRFTINDVPVTQYDGKAIEDNENDDV